MRVYEIIKTTVNGWCTAHGLVPRAEFATIDGNLPERYLLYSVVSSLADAWYGDRRDRVANRVQLDIVVPMHDGYMLPTLYAELLEQMMAAGHIPAGNYRISRDDKSGKAYCQADFFVYE